MVILSSDSNPDFADSNERESQIASGRPENGKKLLFLFVGIGISLALILYLFKDIDFVKFKAEFSNFNGLFILPLTGLMIFSMSLRALRSRYLFPKNYREQSDFGALLEAVLVGFTANSFLPMRAGEIVRPFFLQKRVGLPFASGLASIFTERIFDLLTLLIIASLLLSQISDPPQFLVTTSAALRVISSLGLTGVILCAYCGEFTMKFAQRIVPIILPKKIGDLLLKLLTQVIETLGAAKSFKDLFFILLYSFGIWIATGYYFQLSASMLGVELSLFSGLLVAVTVAFAVAAPSSPGFIGTFQFGCALTLTNILHLTPEFSLAYGLVVHAIQTATLLLVTVLVFSFSGQRLGTLFNGRIEQQAHGIDGP